MFSRIRSTMSVSLSASKGRKFSQSKSKRCAHTLQFHGQSVSTQQSERMHLISTDELLGERQGRASMA